MRRHLPVDGPFEPAALGVPGVDEPPAGLGEVIGPPGQPLHLAGELRCQARTAEGHGSLLGEVGEQTLVEGSECVSTGHRDGDSAQALATVGHRHRDTHVPADRLPTRWPGGQPVGPTRDLERHHDVEGVDGLTRGLGNGRQ